MIIYFFFIIQLERLEKRERENCMQNSLASIHSFGGHIS